MIKSDLLTIGLARKAWNFGFGFHLTTVLWIVAFLSDMSNIFCSAQDLVYVCDIHEYHILNNILKINKHLNILIWQMVFLKINDMKQSPEWLNKNSVSLSKTALRR